MGSTTNIQWCDRSWNPWQGCQKVSPGCEKCYMFRDKRRYGQDPETVVRSKPPTFNRPLRWNRQAREAGRVDRVFVASWADFFSKEADAWRPDAWAIMRECESLIFQVLTKRHGRIAAHLPEDWGDGWDNVWLGVSAENREWWDRRVDALRLVPARVRFVSYEPALGPLGDDVDMQGIHWVIIGGESGHDARPFDIVWARSAIAACKAADVACFVKQLGANVIDTSGRTTFSAWARIKHPKGGDMSEWPEDLRVRQWPRKATPFDDRTPEVPSE